MLAFARWGEVEVQTADLNEMVSSTAQLIQSSIPASVDLAFDFAAKPCHVRVDVTQIQQVIMDLIINAAEALGGMKRRISVKTGLTDSSPGVLDDLTVTPEKVVESYVFVQITDQGCGMSKETLAKIFDPFFTTKFTGRGLGLAAVMGIVKKHSGALKVSTDPGLGSSFTFMLPAVRGKVTKTTAGPSETKMSPRSGTVLIIDDEDILRTVTGRLLARFGFKAILAPSGEEGVELYRQQREKIVFVLLDLTMPGLTGEETFQRFKAVNPGVKVLLMSGFDEGETLSRFSEGESPLFLAKPFGIEALTQRLNALLPKAA